MHEDRAEKIWDIVYGIFEHRAGNVAGALFASEGQANEIQHRLMKSIADFKHKPSSDSANKILADCNLIHAMGWLSENELQQIEKYVGDF